MTVSTTTIKNSYSANGSTVAFSYTFKVFASTEVTVYIRVDATGVETLRAEGTGSTNYAVSGVGETGGGTVTFVTAPLEDTTVVIIRDTALTQLTDYQPADPFPADSHEDALDKLTNISQELSEEMYRTLKVSKTTTITSPEITGDAASRANAFLVFSADGNSLTTSTSAATQHLGTDGSASLPYYSFSSDPNSGWFRIGADNVGLTLGGTKRVDYGTAGMAVTGTITSSGVVSVDDATESTSGTSGSIHTDGGVGIAKKLHVVGVTTHGDNVVSDTDSTDDLGTTGVRWANLFVDAITTTDNQTVGGNLTVTGNLTINGTTVTNDATNLLVKDPLIGINNGASSNASDLGLLMERGSTGNNGFMGWDESGDFFTVGTTTGTADSTGNLTYSFAPFKCSAITATSGTLAGITSLALNAGATITAGILDEDAMGSDSAVALATQQSIKAYVDNNAPENGVKFAWESTTTDTDQGAAKVWGNNGTHSSISVLYIDDVEAGGVSVNAWVDTFDDVSNAVAKGYIYIASYGTTNAILVYKVTGSVVSASTYSKITVAHILTVGTISDGDSIGLTFVPSGADGSGDMSDVVDDSTPQLGGFLDANSKFISHAQGAAIASVAGDTNIWTNFDGNTVHITGTNAITDFGTPKSAGDSMWVIFDAAASVVDSATITVAGNTNYQAAANDLALVYALTTSTFLFMPFPNSGASPVSSAGGGGWLGESGSPLGTSADIIRVNEQTLNNSVSVVGTDNGSATGPLTIASGVTLTISSGATLAII